MYVITYVICSRLGGLILASLYLLVHKQILNPAVNNDAVPPLADHFPGSNLLLRVLPHEQYFKGTKFESQGRATMIASKYSRSTVQAITVLIDRPSFHVTTLTSSLAGKIARVCVLLAMKLHFPHRSGHAYYLFVHPGTQCNYVVANRGTRVNLLFGGLKDSVRAFLRCVVSVISDSQINKPRKRP